MRINKFVILFIFLVSICIVFFIQVRNEQMLKSQPPTSTPTPIYLRASNENIYVDSPGIQQPIGDRIVVRGRARVSGNVVMLRLKDKATNKEYFYASSYADAPDTGQFGVFTYIIDLTTIPDLDLNIFKKGKELLLEVFYHSPHDGSEADKLRILLFYNPKL